MTIDARNFDFYRTANAMSSGGSHAARLKSLPADVKGLAACVQQLVVYDVVANDFYGLDVPERRADEIHIRPVERIIDRIVELDDSPLEKPRSLGRRVIGRCHHFALLTVATLRAHGVPARSRCGFGAYFNPPKFEDHWVCEYWSATEKRWVLADTQFDLVWIEKLGVRHDVLDVPRDHFLVAADAWTQCRSGNLDPARFGIDFVDLRGLWFVAASLIRDLASLNKMEMLPWDVWGAMPEPNARLDRQQLRFFDRLAELASTPDGCFELLRKTYAEDARVHVPSEVFNGLTRRMESVAGLSNTDLEDVAYLCRLPRTFREGAESAHNLVRKSRTSPESINIDAVRAVLDADPALIIEWQRWSEDKRTSSGWFLDCEKGKHVVGHLQRGDRLTFLDAASACAEFIVRELREIW